MLRLRPFAVSTLASRSWRAARVRAVVQATETSQKSMLFKHTLLQRNFAKSAFLLKNEKSNTDECKLN